MCFLRPTSLSILSELSIKIEEREHEEISKPYRSTQLFKTASRPSMYFTFTFTSAMIFILQPTYYSTLQNICNFLRKKVRMSGEIQKCSALELLCLRDCMYVYARTHKQLLGMSFNSSNNGAEKMKAFSPSRFFLRGHSKLRAHVLL